MRSPSLSFTDTTNGEAVCITCTSHNQFVTRRVEERGKMYFINAFYGFIMTSWCCNIGDYSEGELRKVLSLRFLYFLSSFLAAGYGSDIITTGEEGSEDMCSDEA
jgi:hypothetical protein